MIYEPESNWLIQNFPEIFHPGGYAHPPTYVDLGASHPVNKSLTCFARDWDWRGLAIDGNADYFKDWQSAGFGHHFVCAILSDQPTARFAIHDNSFTSRIAEAGQEQPEKWGINRIIEGKVQPLNEILAAHDIGKIHLLTVDLEGMEYAVLKTLDWKKHSPSFVIAEFNTAGTGVDPSVCNLLIGLEYELLHMNESNLIFRRK